MIYLNCREKYEEMIDHPGPRWSSCEVEAWKKIKSDLNGIWSHEPSNTGSLPGNWAIKRTGSWSHLYQYITGRVLEWPDFFYVMINHVL